MFLKGFNFMIFFYDRNIGGKNPKTPFVFRKRIPFSIEYDITIYQGLCNLVLIKLLF